MQRSLFSSAIAVVMTAVLILAGGVAAPARGDDRQPQIPDLKVEKYTLPNGLQVILHEDHTTPVVGVNLWYKVGSKNEKPGRTGFAHLFEHLMFQGSKHHDDEYFGPLEKVGAQLNGSTEHRSHQLLRDRAEQRAGAGPLARVGPHGLPAPGLDPGEARQPARRGQERAAAARTTTCPTASRTRRSIEALYPPDHPYHHSVIGSMADLSAASLEDVSAFFRTYYSPNNASLVHRRRLRPGGDEAAGRRSTSARSRAGPEVAKLAPSVPKLAEPKHLTMTDASRFPGSSSSGRRSLAAIADEPALDVLAAVLGGLDKENRLFRALMYDRQLAAERLGRPPDERPVGRVRGVDHAQPGQDARRRSSRSPTPRSRGSRPRGRPRTRCIKAQNTQESRLIIGLAVGQQQGRLPQRATTSISATRWPTRTRCAGSSRSRRPTSSAWPTST